MTITAPTNTLLHFIASEWKRGNRDIETITDKVMENLSKESLRPAVVRLVSSFISAKTKGAQDRLVRSGRKVRELHRRNLAGTKVDVDPTLVRAALLDHYRDLITKKFFVPSMKATVPWGEATVDQHNEHIRWRESNIAEHQNSIAMHKKAAAFLVQHGFRTLSEVTDEDVIIKLVFEII